MIPYISLATTSLLQPSSHRTLSMEAGCVPESLTCFSSLFAFCKMQLRFE